MKSALGLLTDKFSKLPVFIFYLISFLLVPFFEVLDYFTGNEFSFTIFYLLPIIISAYWTNKYFSFSICFFCALSWYLAEISSGMVYTNKYIPVVNTFGKFIIFLFVSYSLIRLKGLLINEKNLSRLDVLTGCYNRKYLYPVLQNELERAKRLKTSVSVSYIDLDNFKKINDTFGHQTGDRVLKKCVEVLKNNIRKIDSISRVGGDEFVILLLNASEKELKEIFNRLFVNLSREMKKNKWQMVSFSIGVVTCRRQILSVAEIIEKADHLMYKVKKSGKNDVRFLEL